MTAAFLVGLFLSLCKTQQELNTEEKAITGIFIGNGMLAGSAVRIRGWTRE